jgi:hypothetical protein
MLNWKENERKLSWSDVDDVLEFFYRNLEREINSTFEVAVKRPGKMESRLQPGHKAVHSK